jgi:hypothetical protein
MLEHPVSGVVQAKPKDVKPEEAVQLEHSLDPEQGAEGNPE